MATLREIKRRITSIKSTQKITRAMKMIAGVRFRRAQENLFSIRPYSRKMSEILYHFTFNSELISHPLFKNREVKNSLIIVISSDRGMCGAFNSNIVKGSIDYVNNQYPDLKENPNRVKFITIGKKASDHLSKRGMNILEKYSGGVHNMDLNFVNSFVQKLTEGFLNKAYDKIEIIYNEFKSVTQQRMVVEQFLPISPQKFSDDFSDKIFSQAEYIYEPSYNEIFSMFIPKYLNFQILRILLESNTAEESARMTAMNLATENANELIEDLTLVYNKARQANITRELIEVMSGADALTKMN